MPPQAHQPHMLHLPRLFDIIKYIQLAIAILTLGLSAFCVYVLTFSAPAYAIFVSLYTTGIIIYYLIASKKAPKSYNWIALLVLEILAVLFWLATWAALGALIAALYYLGTHSSSSYYYYKRSLLEARSVYSYSYGYAGCLIAAIALAVVNFLLYILTLVYMSRAVHQHRKSGQPLTPNGQSNTASTYANGYPATNGTAPDYEKGTASIPMQPMSTN